jgi:periplasmic protein TonB
VKNIAFLIFIISLVIAGCEKEKDTANIKTTDSFHQKEYFVAVEQMPEPIGGIEAIQNEVVYPENAKDGKIEGKVYILMFINEFGDVVKAEILKSAHPSLDSAALNAVKKVKFVPGKQKDKNVKTQVVVPIVFKLNSDK